VAFCGASGSGKSTIINLLERFYNCTSGEILLDGKPLDSYSPAWLRRSIGLVSQNPALFATTIADNIKYGDENATDEQVRQAAIIANADSFIRSLPGGYETNVGERGLALSGGQKQRIAIARAVLKNPKILLLDEATSALDTVSEREVEEALDKVMEGRTCLIIAHRLSTIVNSHNIVVLQNGRFVEMGTHQELLSRGGVYKELFEKQLQRK